MQIQEWSGPEQYSLKNKEKQLPGQVQWTWTGTVDLRLCSGLDLDSILGPFGDLLAALGVQWAPGERLELSRGLLGSSWWPLGLAWEPLGACIVDLSSKPSIAL